MKYLIASDIHGSAYFTEKLISEFRKEKADKLILLGDIYNHGPRNPFPERFDEMKVAKMLNAEKEHLLVIKGNCDSEVDTLISEFDFLENLTIVDNGKTLFLSHGHIYNKENPPKTRFDVVMYGHLHTGFIEENNGTVFVNTGSISLPKNGTAESYVLYDEGTIYLKAIDGEILKQCNLL